MMTGKSMPFDAKRMIYGGFKVIVDLRRSMIPKSGNRFSDKIMLKQKGGAAPGADPPFA
jgi:hypothetical protein